MLEPAPQTIARSTELGTKQCFDRRLRVALVGNFPPRRCGIATFTSDLHGALTNDAGVDCDVYAMSEADKHYAFPKTVTRIIRDNSLDDFVQAARWINSSSADCVLLQHEYGIFGGSAGDKILALLGRLEKPIVTTLHTVLAEPSQVHRRVMNAVLRVSTRVIVMTHRGRDLLKEIHGADSRKTTVVPHGAPDRPFLDGACYKQDLGYEGKDVLLTFGLLSPNKGLQFVIAALPAIRARHANVLYVVLGATHPHLIAVEGERYREGLEALAAELGVQDNVQFINSYTDTQRLISFLVAADIYITPYLNEGQVTSGTLAYAIALGKPIISTPYWHAAEALGNGCGILVPFGNSAALADATISLLSDSHRRRALQMKAYAAGRNSTWSKVAARYAAILREVVAPIQWKNDRDPSRIARA